MEQTPITPIFDKWRDDRVSAALEDADISQMVGHVLVNVEGMCVGSEVVIMTSLTGRWLMQYEPDCCASADIIDVIGDPEDLIGEVLLIARADQSSSDDDVIKHPADYKDKDTDSHTWTFYTFATRKGYVTLRWLGQSNGYYSESVSFYKARRDPRS